MKVLLAGSTGYLGSYIFKELIARDIPTRLVVRNTKKLDPSVLENSLVEVLKAEVTRPETLSNCCEGIDTVISTVGITRQKDGLTYMDVDYQANMNLLKEAQNAGVRKFIYVSVLNGEHLKGIKICEAKERFVEALKESGLKYCIVRPNGFFSDMTEFYDMAKKGRIYLFGDGTLRFNPIHGEDLAKECVNVIDSETKELNIGGPETLTQNEIAEMAFEAAGEKPKIIHIPDWIRRMALSLAKWFMSEQKFGPVEFFMTVMAMEMTAPEYGSHTLRKYFNKLNDNGFFEATNIDK